MDVFGFRVFAVSYIGGMDVWVVFGALGGYILGGSNLKLVLIGLCV